MTDNNASPTTTTTSSTSSSTSQPSGRPRARVLLVGSGRMGQLRAKAIYANPRLELCGIVDANVDAAAKLGEMYRAPHFVDITQAVTHNVHNGNQRVSSMLDGVVISTPTPTHKALICEAAVNGLSIFIEKPVGETSESIRDAYAVARQYNVQLCCGFQRRFDPSYLSLHRQVHTLGSIGTPLSATIFFGDHPVPTRSFLLAGGGNIISDCSAHDIDFIRWVLQDEVCSVYATGTSSDDELRENNVIDNATMVMKFVKGTVVTLTLSRGANYGYDQRCEVFGTNGLVSITNTSETSTCLANSNGVHLPKLQHSFPQRFEVAFANEIDAFADTLLLGTSWPVSEEDCVAVQKVCDCALLSCESGEVVRVQQIR